VSAYKAVTTDCADKTDQMPYEVFLHSVFAVAAEAAAGKGDVGGCDTRDCDGVAALIVAFALSNGFRDEMREKILQGTAHLSVVRADGRAIENYQSSQTVEAGQWRCHCFGDDL
jgi:hypothetical protein